MTPGTIQTVILEVLEQVQTLCGRDWKPMGAGTKPIGAVSGFDSLCSIEATVLVEQKLGCAPLGPSSLFISEDGKSALTLQQVSERIHKLITAQRKQ
jgi:hypothetical protein